MNGATKTSPRPVSRHGATVVVGGVVLLVVGALGLLCLDVFPPVRSWNPLQDTLSQAQFGPGAALFRLAVGCAVLGSTAIVLESACSRGRRLGLPVAVLTVGWSSGIAIVMVTVPNVRDQLRTAMGTFHETAATVAFICLPLALSLLSRGLDESDPQGARYLRLLLTAVYATLAITLAGRLVALAAGVPWQHYVPVGLLQRLLAAASTIGCLLLARAERGPR